MESRRTDRNSGPLHVAEGFDFERGIVSFYCDTNPTTTVRSFGPPLRCPFCRQPHPVSTEFGRNHRLRKLQR